MRFGIFVPQGWRFDLVGIPPEQHWATMKGLALAAEAGPWESLWVYDHFHTTPVASEEATHEAWTLMAAFAAVTDRIRLGQMCTCVAYRNPAYLAKVAATVDHISGGRLEMGIGAGWYEHEWRAYGYGFPEVPVRMRMFKEACEILHRMFTEDKPTFGGEFYQIDQPINEPKGIQKPHPPIWIGGGGEKVTLKLVARWGDATNVGGDVETLKHKFEVLKGHCENVGRDYEEITRSTSINVYLLEEGVDPEEATKEARGSKSYDEYSKEYMVGTPEEIMARLNPMVEAGVNYFIAYLPRVAYDPAPVERFAKEVIPHIG